MSAAKPAATELQLQINNSGAWKTLAWFPRRANHVRRAKSVARALDHVGARARFRIIRPDGAIVSFYDPEGDGWRDAEAAR